MSALWIGLVLPWVLLGIGCWMGWQLLRQHGRMLLRLEEIERQLAALRASTAATAGSQNARPSLPVGSAAPEFELLALSGERLSLSRYRGRRVLLVFFNPRCGFCVRMAADFAALPVDGGERRPIPLIVTSGTPDDNQRVVDEHGIRCPMLLQKQAEVMTLYQVQGTPNGYLIDEEGRIASPVAVGAEAILRLAGESVTEPSGSSEAHVGSENGRKTYKGNRSLADSRINRNGLPAGTHAVEFRLPRVDGGELSLADYRGRRMLLVFSDPHCGPCNALAPQLEQLQRLRPDIQVLMVSRGDPAENRRKVAELGLTFPVVLQKQWEISKAYGMFATPIGYLIDERGVIAADVALGPDAILALGSDVFASSREEGAQEVLNEVAPRQRSRR